MYHPNAAVYYTGCGRLTSFFIWIYSATNLWDSLMHPLKLKRRLTLVLKWTSPSSVLVTNWKMVSWNVLCLYELIQILTWQWSCLKVQISRHTSKWKELQWALFQTSFEITEYLVSVELPLTHRIRSRLSAMMCTLAVHQPTASFIKTATEQHSTHSCSNKVVSNKENRGLPYFFGSNPGHIFEIT
jgi:hypothetical protein